MYIPQYRVYLLRKIMRNLLLKQLNHIHNILRNNGIMKGYLFECDYKELEYKILDYQVLSSKLIIEIENFFINSLEKEIKFWSSEDILNTHSEYIEYLKDCKNNFMII